MRRDVLAAVAATCVLASGCVAAAPDWARSGAPRFVTTVALPRPTTGQVPLDAALQGRRSVREFRPEPLPTATIGQLLWAAQGVTRADGRRTAPSAGARYPLELYAVTADSVLHYLPDGHRVEQRPSVDLRGRLSAAALDQPAVSSAPLVVVVAAVPSRTAARYGGRADAFVEREVGHATQNLLLEATASGLGAVPIGGLDGDAVAHLLGLPPDRSVYYLVPVGRPR